MEGRSGASPVISSRKNIATPTTGNSASAGVKSIPGSVTTSSGSVAASCAGVSAFCASLNDCARTASPRNVAAKRTASGISATKTSSAEPAGRVNFGLRPRAQAEDAGLEGQQHAHQVRRRRRHPDQRHGRELPRHDLRRGDGRRQQRLQRAALLLPRRHVDGGVKGAQQRHHHQDQREEAAQRVPARLLRSGDGRVRHRQRRGEGRGQPRAAQPHGEKGVAPVVQPRRPPAPARAASGRPRRRRGCAPAATHPPPQAPRPAPRRPPPSPSRTAATVALSALKTRIGAVAVHEPHQRRVRPRDGDLRGRRAQLPLPKDGELLDEDQHAPDRAASAAPAS